MPQYPPLHRNADHHRLHLGPTSLLQVPPGEEWAASPVGTHLGWVVGSSGAWCPRGLCLTSEGLSLSLGPDL